MNMELLKPVLIELGVLGVFLTGLVLSRMLKRRWHPSEIIIMYVFGFLFEVLTAHMWSYLNVFLTFSFTVAKHISILSPLGWAGLVMGTTAIAERLWKRFRIRNRVARHCVLMMAWLLLGGGFEITFYNVGMFEYIRSQSTQVNFVLGQLPHMPPNMVFLGYFLIMPFISQYFRWLEDSI